ncbi:GGDEF domain-containing protein [Clostridium grantii]|uniref:GGDEF domain-containing protein n=1 Tax=Clostridium grantii TaxID=40575 RepID=UPI0013565688|nr:GGDEF domain-containing protein [Clostridium grantii]
MKEKNYDFNEIYEFIFQYSSISIIELDKDRNIVCVNKAFTKLANSQENYINKPFTQYFEIESKVELNDFSYRGENKKNDVESIYMISVKYNKGNGRVSKIKGKVIKFKDKSIVFLEDLFISEEEIISKMSEMNIEMMGLTRELAKKNIELKKANNEISKLVNTDYLTGLSNRREFYKRLEENISLIERTECGNIGLIMADIDFFKKVNDSYGHDIGDQVLIAFSNMLKSNIRKEDLVARIGGEEFCILVASLEISKVAVLAEKLRKKCEEMWVEIDKLKESINITASFGVTVYKNDDMKENKDKFLKRADLALYKAKNSGRNKVVVFEEYEIDMN